MWAGHTALKVLILLVSINIFQSDLHIVSIKYLVLEVDPCLVSLNGGQAKLSTHLINQISF